MEVPAIKEDTPSNEKEPSPSPGKADRQKFKRERPGPYPKGSRGRAVGGPPFNRVLVTNIPYEEKWQALKDLFRQKIGEVTYVELFTDENGRSRGYGVIEFRTKDLCEEAVKNMNKHEILGRKIIVKEDYNGDLIGRVLRRDGVVNSNNRPSGGPAMPPMPPPMRRQDMPPVGVGGGMNLPNLPRLGAGDALDLQKVFQRNGAGVGPMGKTVFIANLDYKVTYAKLKEVFSLAGRIFKIDLLLDKDNKSRGMATITYEEPMDAAQAISMLNGQLLFDRPMVVKMDKDNNNRDGFKLPAGLSGIGPTLNARHRPGDFGPFKGPGSVGDLNPNPAVGLLGGGALAGLSALSQQANHLNDALQSNPLVESRNTLGAMASLAGLSDLSRLASMGGGGRDPSLDQRFLEDRARLIAAAQAGISGAADRERIEMDIARVDSRIRDLNRSIVDRGRRTVDLPPMPPPMNMARNNGNNGGMMNPSHQRRGCTVFVRNLAYTITWQQLRERFSRCGSVMFADIKMDNQGKSRGFGYVRFEEPDQAMGSVRVFDGMDWEGRKLAVELKPENRD